MLIFQIYVQSELVEQMSFCQFVKEICIDLFSDLSALSSSVSESKSYTFQESRNKLKKI